METQEEMSRYFWSASTNCLPVMRDKTELEARNFRQMPVPNDWLALVSICEIDVMSFSEDGRGVKWLCN